ncbi:hypothetical protein [Methylopila sp. M107]|uniref:hypothetical protein n=1 Tax=Methylopila sp. M107 TaxID=1101190 RepID=UPI00037E90D1|nr:hypothetical protein [Methylopila sp. M107]
MDAPIASIALQPLPQRPIELDRVRPVEPLAQSAGRTESEPPSFASQAQSRQNSRLTAERSIERDVDTGSLVYRLIDLSSGIVTVQTPSDARLKLRAYIDGVIASGQQPAIEVMA